MKLLATLASGLLMLLVASSLQQHAKGQVAPTFKSFSGFEVEGNDIPCNGKPVCRLCEKADQMTSAKAKTACVRNPACVAYVWDHTKSDFCWILKSSAKPAVYNADTDLTVIEGRATAANEQGKTPVRPSVRSFSSFEVEGNDIPCGGKPICRLCEKADQMTTNKAETACVRNPSCQAIVWDHSKSDFCWTLKSAAKPAVYNLDKDLKVIQDRATATDVQGKTPVAPSFKTVSSYEVEGHDIPCNGKPVCRLCEKADQMTTNKAKTACVRNNSCQAIVWDHSKSDFCWTLKSAAKPAVYNADKDLYVVERSK